MKQSGAWKNLEKLVAKALNGKRISRGADFSKSDVDVVVEDFPALKIDAKYRKRWAHHTFLEEVEQKYCGKTDVPILVTKTPHQQSAVVSLDLKDFANLLNALRRRG